MRTDLRGRVTHDFTTLGSVTIHSISAGTGVPLVLLHSLGCSALEFSDNFDELGRHHRVLAWDMAGHGDSDGAGRHRTIEQQADILIEWLEALALAPCHLAGVSIGGLIALDVAARRPDLIRTVALIEAGMFSSAHWEARWPLVEQTFGYPQQSAQEIELRFRAVDDVLLDRWNMDRMKAGAATMVAGMWALRRYDWQNALRKLSCPTLLLYGSKSPVLESVAAAQEILSDATSLVLDDCGHFPMVDDPTAFNEAIEGFIRQHS